MYLGCFKRHEMNEGDKPPIGILLCTQKDKALVEYAQEDVNNDFFISDYIKQNLLAWKNELGKEM
jgi:hypothetical protein